MSIEFKGQTYPGILDYKSQLLEDIAKQIKLQPYALGVERQITQRLQKGFQEDPDGVLHFMIQQVSGYKKGFKSIHMLSYAKDKPLYLATNRASKALHIDIAPTIFCYEPDNIEYIYQALSLGFCGNLNVFFSQQFVSQHLFTQDETTFVIGHELGHSQCNHLFQHFGKPAEKTNLFSQLLEYSADRAGLIACGSLEASCLALMKVDFATQELIDRCRSTGRVLPEDAGVLWKKFEATDGTSLQSTLDSIEIIVKSLTPDTGTHPNLYRRICALKHFWNSELCCRLTGREPGEGAMSDAALQLAMNALTRQEGR